MRLDAGDVIVVRFPHTDGTASKQRPALVLTPASYNAGSPDIVAAYVTSQTQAGPWSVPVTDHDLDAGHLVRPSWIRVDRLATMEKALVKKSVGRLGQAARDAVRRRLVGLLAPEE